MHQPNPELLDELYHKQRKNFPNELPFPERFNLKLTEDAFNTGIRRKKKWDVKKIVDWKGNPIREESVTVITYKIGSRLDKAFETSIPKSVLRPLSHVYTELYNNMQIGSKDDALDLEYNFFFHPADKRIETILQSFDTELKWNEAFQFYRDKPLRVRIQYAERIVNSAGPRWDCYGYIYLPKNKN